MSGDWVTRAADALRERHIGVGAASAETRRAILAVASRRGRGRRAAVMVLAPLAAVLALSTAWAAVTGRLPRWLTLSPRAELSPARSGSPMGSQHGPALASATASAPASQTATATATAPASASRFTPPTASMTGLPPASAAARALTAASDAEEALFAAAHKAHFVDRKPDAALHAWDAYLAAYPRGHFALEARYNRALSLARLGRNDEARAALAPFADGRFGPYRQREARELIDVLDGSP